MGEFMTKMQKMICLLGVVVVFAGMSSAQVVGIDPQLEARFQKSEEYVRRALGALTQSVQDAESAAARAEAVRQDAASDKAALRQATNEAQQAAQKALEQAQRLQAVVSEAQNAANQVVQTSLNAHQARMNDIVNRANEVHQQVQNSINQDRQQRSQENQKMIEARAALDAANQKNLRDDHQAYLAQARKEREQFVADMKEHQQKALEALRDGLSEGIRKGFDMEPLIDSINGLTKGMKDAAEIRGDAQVKSTKYKWDSISTMAKGFGSGFMDFTADKGRMAKTFGGIIAVVVAIYGAKTLWPVLAGAINRYLSTPPLLQKSSVRGSMAQMAAMFGFYDKPREVDLADIVVSAETAQQLKDTVESVELAREHGAKLPNVGLFGPPGTGKTMFIEAMASMTGMTFAMMTGSDVSKLVSSGERNEAVHQINKVMDWLEAHGPSIFLIDEVDALAAHRSGGKRVMSEGLQQAVNALLFRTGAASSKVMLVITTNHPEELDWAFESRISKWIKLGLPEQPEREKLLREHIQKLASTDDRLAFQMSEEDVAKLAARMDGWSGRDIDMKFIDAYQREAISRGFAPFTYDLADKVLKGIEADRSQLASWKLQAQAKNAALSRIQQGQAAATA